jgi:histidyl-tRNA synthetase
MGYYTSTIFEITYGNLGYSIAGGGRYDKMIGKISGVDVPAVGFSIGFERIVDLLISENKVTSTDEKIALIYSENDALAQVVKAAIQMRANTAVVSLYQLKKKLGKQLKQLEKAGYTGYVLYSEQLEVKRFEV